MRKRTGSLALWVTVLSIMAGSPWAAAQAGGSGGEGGKTPPRASTALPQVREARALEAVFKGLRGEKRREAQLQAARAWAKAAQAQGQNPAGAARARVRQAVLLALAGDAAGAEAAWKQVLELDPNRQGARALVGLADLARRAGKIGRALELYEEAARRFPEGGAPVQAALIWAGKLHMRAGRMDRAREALARVLRMTSSARRMAYAYDLLVQTWLRQGNLDKAREAYQEARTALERLGKGDKRREKAARKALEGMRSPARIRRALEAAGKKKERPAPENGARRP